jgi:N-acetylglucosamine-6-sulfatase
VPAGQRSRPPAKRPNIVFVLTDDLAWNLVRYMPHVLAMERQGETFSNYYVTDSLCCPSRASIFTGRFPHDTGVFSNEPPNGGMAIFNANGDERSTFATQLQGSGYHTALMGKYLNGYQPAATEGGSTPYVPPGWNEWDVAGDGYPEYGYTMNSDAHVSAYGHEPREYLTDVLAGKGLRFIAQSAAHAQPFVLELSTFAPHQPFTPAARDLGDFPGLKAPRSPAFDAMTTGAPAWLKDFAPLDAAQVRKLDRQFRKRAQAVQAVDRMIGEIEAELVAKGLAQNTYLVFSSDNGLHMGEHRLMTGKLTPYDTDIRVPLIVVGPGVPAGRTVAAMSENTDLCPTFDQLGGAPIPSNVDGHSLVPLLRGQPTPSWRREILVEHRGPDIGPSDPDLPRRGSGNPPSYEAIRSRQSLYVEYATGEREYYNLAGDPFELHNLATHLTPAHARRLHRALRAIVGCHGGRACWRAQHLPT